MKRKIYSFLLLTFTSIFNVYSQSARIVDLRVSIVSPIKNSSIKSPGIAEVKFSVFNKGKDDLKPIDKIFFYPVSADSLYKVKIIYPTKVIHPLDSEIFSVFIPYNSPYDQNNYNIGVIGLSAFNNSSDSLRSETLDMQNDNSATITLKHRSATSKISHTNFNKLMVYPNPIVDFLNLEFEKTGKDVNVSIIDINGIEIKKVYLDGFLSSAKIDCTKLVSGIYYVKCMSDNEVVYKKIYLLR